MVQDDVETDYPTFHRFRRLMRRWRLAEARAIKDPERRRAAIVQACGSLKCSRRDVSPYHVLQAGSCGDDGGDAGCSECAEV